LSGSTMAGVLVSGFLLTLALALLIAYRYWKYQKSIVSVYSPYAELTVTSIQLISTFCNSR
jgi:hypothetical protein